jgi:hypothetical protein
MKRTLKYALLASAAAFVLGMAMPSQAQQDDMQAAGATSQQRVYQPNEADRYSATRDDDAATSGYEAYDYAPAAPGYGDEGCATQGTYGKGIDYAACGGGN